MITMNLKARLKNKTWWIGIISLIVLLSQQCGFDLSAYIPKNYTDIINTLFAFLAAIGITVDTSTPGVSDEIVAATVQAVNAAEETQTESSTTSVNNVVTENSQDSSADASATSINKESETNTTVQASSNVILDAATQAAVLAAAQAAIQANNSTAQA